jgi:regulator of protease activity HflC (stomatin/prohibitin superfamily)
MPEWLHTVVAWALSAIKDYARDSAWALALAAWAIVRATGVTIDTGQTGLLFSFGRARAVLGPGFRFLIPFLQVVKILPTRHRTLHLPAQRVTTREGLVLYVDANLVYRVIDVRKALIEIDHLEKGMTQALGLGVQAVLRERERADVRAGPDVDAALAANLGGRLEPWGVEVVRAGFITITPSPESLRVTQLEARVAEREKALAAFERAGLPRGHALALLGTRARLLTRVRGSREKERVRRARKRLERRILQAGFRNVHLEEARGAPLSSISRTQPPKEAPRS